MARSRRGSPETNGVHGIRARPDQFRVGQSVRRFSHGSIVKLTSPTMKLDADEKELLESVERGEWKSARGGKRERTRYTRYAKATFRKDRRLKIRLSSKDPQRSLTKVAEDGPIESTLFLPQVPTVATANA
jgi:predicted DNA binding CopG/RHH family protein